MKSSHHLLVCMLCLSLLSCTNTGKKAHDISQQSVYTPISYKNASVPGPEVVVLPGIIHGAGAPFIQDISRNGIRDFAEIELSKANFKVLDRAEALELRDAFLFALEDGDAQVLAAFKSGPFKPTKWVMSFDILKAEPASSVRQDVDGSALGLIVGLAIGFAVSPDLGRAVGATVGSIQGSDTSDIWTVGLRYKIVDTSNGQQVATGYFEEKLERQEQSQSFIGITQSQKSSTSFDSVVQKLVQKAVQDVDSTYKINGENLSAVDKQTMDPSEYSRILATYKDKVSLKQQSANQAKETIKNFLISNEHNSLDSFAEILCHELRIEFQEIIKQLPKSTLDMIEKSDSSAQQMPMMDFEVVEIHPDRCVIQRTTHYSFIINGKEYQNIFVDEFSMIKEDDGWKICGIKAPSVNPL